SVQLRFSPGIDVELNEEFARALEAALAQARARGLVSGALTPGDLLRMPQAITVRDRQPGDDEETQAAIAKQALEAAGHALVDLDSMRLREGEHLRTDLDSRRIFVADLVERIAAAADEGRAAMGQRVAGRVRELRVDLQADETAVAQEIVRMRLARISAKRWSASARTSPTGAHWPTAPSRAAASSISSCRR